MKSEIDFLSSLDSKKFSVTRERFFQKRLPLNVVCEKAGLEMVAKINLGHVVHLNHAIFLVTIE
jgi:hypothetical protein